MFKKLTIALAALSFLGLPSSVLAATEQVCTQPYGSGVVCGVHTVVDTGLGENLAIAGTVLLLASGVLLFISKKLNALN